MPNVVSMQPTQVVNLRADSFDVYIGRAGHGRDGYFGNPFPLAFGSSDEERDACIAKFKEYFLNRLETDATFKQRVHELRGKTLGCFCKPRRCHGDIIVEYLNSLTKETT